MFVGPAFPRSYKLLTLECDSITWFSEEVPEVRLSSSLAARVCILDASYLVGGEAGFT